jgi:proline-specific peptidase
VKVDEGRVPVPGGNVWYRSVGEGGGVPLLCLHGGPGAPSDYLKPLEALADRRRVVFYDQLGCGNSDVPDDRSLWTVERFMDELDAVRDALGLDRVHLFGSSWGGMLAMQYVLDKGRPPVSLITAGSPASSRRWNEICQELLDELPADERETIERLEAEDKTGTPQYEEALGPFYRRHVCRLDPWPDYVVRSFDRMATPIYHYMAGPSEFRIIGTLRDWDVMDRLGEIRVPALITCGEFDECRPAHTREVAARIPGGRLEIIPDASHLCFVERPDLWMPIANEFMAAAESA